jgi:hypothetical protein
MALKKGRIWADPREPSSPAARQDYFRTRIGRLGVSGESIPSPIFTLCKSKSVARRLKTPHGHEGMRQVDHPTSIDSISKRFQKALC